MAGAIDATLRKFHASLNVSDLERSIAFYRVLLGVEPAKVRIGLREVRSGGAAARAVADSRPARGRRPSESRRAARPERRGARRDPAPPRGRRHADRARGRRRVLLRAADEVLDHAIRIGALWEIYVFHDDIDEHGDAAPPHDRGGSRSRSSRRAPAPRVWEHHLREPIPGANPARRQLAARSPARGLDQRGARAPSIRADLFARVRCGRCARARRSTCTGSPATARAARRSALPGPAAAVQHVPAASDVVEELARAGFADIPIEKLSETAYFVVDGVPMRELRIAARKPGHRPARGDASGDLSRTDERRSWTTSARVPARRADAAQRPRLADAGEERR